MKHNPLFIVATAIGLATALPVAAHRFGGPGKDWQCVHDCLGTARSCADAARTDFQMCRQSTCPDQLAAVDAACGSSRPSDACRSARQALTECAQPCRDAYRTAAQNCGTTARGCVGQCPARQPSPPADAACVASCRSTLGQCLQTAQGDGKNCRSGCSSLAQSARQACGWHWRSSACRTANQALYACVQPCNQTEGHATHDCIQAATTCVSACPEPTPTP